MPSREVALHRLQRHRLHVALRPGGRQPRNSFKRKPKQATVMVTPEAREGGGSKGIERMAVGSESGKHVANVGDNKTGAR